MRKRNERKRRERDEKLSQALRIVEAEFKVPEVNNAGDVNEPYPENSIVDWSNVPRAVDPTTTLLTKLKKKGRAMRKRQQLESLVYHIKRLFPYSDANIDIVEFGCGQGHLGLFVAHLYRNARVTLLDFNPYVVFYNSFASYSDIFSISTQTPKLKHQPSQGEDPNDKSTHSRCELRIIRKTHFCLFFHERSRES